MYLWRFKWFLGDFIPKPIVFRSVKLRCSAQGNDGQMLKDFQINRQAVFFFLVQWEKRTFVHFLTKLMHGFLVKKGIIIACQFRN